MNTQVISNVTVKAMRIVSESHDLLLDKTNFAAYLNLQSSLNDNDKKAFHCLADGMICKAYDAGMKKEAEDYKYSENLFIKENQCFKQVAKGLQEVMDEFRKKHREETVTFKINSSDFLILLSAIQFPLIKAATTSETPTQQAVDDMKETLKILMGL